MSQLASPPLVALTYSAGRLRGLAARLRHQGIRVIRRPLLAVTTTTPPAQELAWRALGCPWVLFASPSAVAAWRDWGFPVKGLHVGATGPGTRESLRRLGATVSVVGSPADATGLARAFMEHPEAKGPVALPRGNRALPTLPRLLAAAGYGTVPLPAYRSEPRSWEPRELPSAVVVASPSALAALPARVAGTATLVAIGATTGAAARRVAPMVVEAPDPTVEGVWRALQLALQPTLDAPTGPSGGAGPAQQHPLLERHTTPGRPR